MGGALALPYNALVSESPGQDAQREPSGQVQLRIIVVESLGEAQQIVERLKKGEDFTALAKEASSETSIPRC